MPLAHSSTSLNPAGLKPPISSYSWAVCAGSPETSSAPLVDLDLALLDPGSVLGDALLEAMAYMCMGSPQLQNMYLNMGLWLQNSRSTWCSNYRGYVAGESALSD